MFVALLFAFESLLIFVALIVVSWPLDSTHQNWAVLVLFARLFRRVLKFVFSLLPLSEYRPGRIRCRALDRVENFGDIFLNTDNSNGRYRLDLYLGI